MQTSCISSIMRVQKPKMTLLYNLLQKMCKQIANILSIRSDSNRHLRFPVFRASAQGGDRYPKHGTDQFDRVLPQNLRRPDRTGKAGVRCSRSSSNPANQIAELPHKPKIRASGCGHRNSKGKKQGTDLNDGLYLASFYARPLKYRSQHFTLITFLPLSHSCKQRTGIPIFLANGFLPMPKDSRYARMRTACPS